MIPTLANYPHTAATPFGLNNWQGYKWHAQTANKPWSIGVNGPRYARFEVRPEDVVSFDDYERPDIVNRSEAFIPSSTGLTQFPIGVPIWLAFAMRVPAECSLEADPDTPSGYFPGLFCGQFHADVGKPVWSQQLQTNGDLVIATCFDWSATPTGQGAQTVRYRIEPLTLDVWHQFVYCLTFNKTTNGQMKMWHNGIKRFDAAIPMGYNNNSLYLKTGIYRHNMLGRSVVEFANVEAGTADLTARTTTPLPLP